MRKLIFITLITSLLISLTLVDCQAQYRSKKGKRSQYRFNAGFVLGVNSSQIDGDHFAGFNKTGIRVGVKAMIYLHKKWDVTTGISFVQRGSRFEDFRSGILNRKTDRKIHLDYIEVPLLLTYKLLQKNGSGYRINFGGSFGRLFNSEVIEVLPPFAEIIEYGALQNQFQKNEINLMTDLSYFFNSRIGLGFQFTLQLNKLYDNPNYNYTADQWREAKNDIRQLQNYQFGIQLTYHVF